MSTYTWCSKVYIKFPSLFLDWYVVYMLKYYKDV